MKFLFLPIKNNLNNLQIVLLDLVFKASLSTYDFSFSSCIGDALIHMTSMFLPCTSLEYNHLSLSLNIMNKENRLPSICLSSKVHQVGTNVNVIGESKQGNVIALPKLDIQMLREVAKQLAYTHTHTHKREGEDLFLK